MKYRVQGVSFPDEDLYWAGVARAKSERRSFSNYVCGLIEADLKAAGMWPPHDRGAVTDELRVAKAKAAGKSRRKTGS